MISGSAAPQSGFSPEHARREALPAVEPLIPCVMRDIIPTEAKLTNSLAVSLPHACNAQMQAQALHWLGLGIFEFYAAQSGISRDYHQAAVGITTHIISA